MPDAHLPTGQDLASRLFDLGLAPPGCEEIAAYGTPRYWYRLNGELWQPETRIQDCWYLMEVCELSIEYAPVRGPCWWVTPRLGGDGIKATEFAAIPTAICHASLKWQSALKLQARRNG